MLSVVTKAPKTGLTTLSTVKSALNISGTAQDPYLTLLIDQASTFVCDYLGVAQAEDGTKTLGHETLQETFLLRECRSLIQLARVPIIAVTSIVEDDSHALSQDDYMLTKATGFIRRMRGSAPGLWHTHKVTVSYSAGWVLPDEEDSNLPAAIQAAVIDIIKNERSARTRSADVKVEDIPDVMRTEYFANIMNTPGAVSPQTAAKLDPYIQYRP